MSKPVYVFSLSHYIGIEQTTEKLTEMKLEGEKKAAPTQPNTTVPLVGGATVEDDSDSDSEPAVDIDDFKEEEDPVIYITDKLQSHSVTLGPKLKKT